MYKCHGWDRFDSFTAKSDAVRSDAQQEWSQQLESDIQSTAQAESVAQATAVGTALSIHKEWNTKSLPTDIIELKHYSVSNAAKL